MPLQVSSAVPAITLNTGAAMPRLGLGVAKVNDDVADATVSAALELGYRLVDTAAEYDNERGVGVALRRSGVRRSELFVTTKLWNSEHGRERPRQALEGSLGRLGLDYVDLYLIHWPVPLCQRYVETWLALEELHEEGLARAIGVSNFEPAHLAAIMNVGAVVPAVNQIELHPWLQQRALRAVHEQHGIATEAWSPFAKGRMLEDPSLAPIAERHGISPAQVVLRWQLQIGNIAIPKTVTPSRMKENLAAAGLPPLDDQELEAMAALERGTRIGPHPDEFHGLVVDEAEDRQMRR